MRCEVGLTNNWFLFFGEIIGGFTELLESVCGSISNVGLSSTKKLMLEFRYTSIKSLDEVWSSELPVLLFA